MKKGFAQLIPLVVIALLVFGGMTTLSIQSQNSQKAAVGKVLSEKSGGGEGSEDHGGSSDSSSSNSNSSDSSKSSGKSDENKSSNTTSESSKSESKTKSESKVENKQEKSNSKIEVKKSETKTEFETESETESEGSSSAKIEEKIRIGGLRIEVKTENGKVVTKIKNKNDEDVEVEGEVEKELQKQTDDILEEDDIKIATGSAQIGFTEHGKKVRTNFPLSVNPTTGELTVTTPKGTKIVAILPSVAIQNMIKAGVISTLDQPPTTDTSPPQGTGSAITSVLGAETELTTEDNGTIVYKIKGIKNENFIGIIPVNLKITAVVSAENSELISTQEGFLTHILDLLSF